MIEVYSENITVAENSPVPFNNVMRKGNYETMGGSLSIELNHAGVYRLHCHGSVSGAGDIVIQATKDGVAIPQTVIPITGTADADVPFAFETLIQVNHNNGPCCCKSPVTIQIVNDGIGVTFPVVAVNVTKVC